MPNPHNSAETCAGCMFFDSFLVSVVGFGDCGTCLRYPPQGRPKANSINGSYQPLVPRSGWCGEYTPIPSKRTT